MVARAQVVDVGPVGHGHAVEAQLVFEQAREHEVTGVHRFAVDHSRVYHHRLGAGADGGFECGQMHLSQYVFGDVGRRAVLSRERCRVAQEVLEADGHAVGCRHVGAFESAHRGQSHLRGQADVFAEGLPVARPAGVDAEVEHGGEHPRDARGARLVGRYGRAFFHQVGVPGGGHGYLLREEGGALRVVGSVDGVDAIDDGDAEARLRGGHLLQRADDGVVPFVEGHGHAVGRVEERAHVACDYGLPCLGRVDGQRQVAAVGRVARGDGVDGHLRHLSHFLFERHQAQQAVHALFGAPVGGGGGRPGAGRECGDGCERGRSFRFHGRMVFCGLCRLLGSMLSHLSS